MAAVRTTLALGLLAACERANRRVPAETTAAVGPAATPPSAPTGTSGRVAWDPAAGQLLLIPGDAPDHALVFAPDSVTAATDLAALPRPALVNLFGRTGSVQAAELPQVAAGGACFTATLQAAPPPKPWNVGFFGGVVTPIAVDSAQSIAPADSAALVVEVARLASSLPNDSAGRFTGLPFVVRTLWRFAIPGGPLVLVANTDRQINQEATPLEERTLIVAERDPQAADSAFSMAYSERSYGEEETIESHDLMAAVSIGDARTPALVIARDFGDAVSYALIERTGASAWRVRWTSGRRQCAGT